MWGCFSNNDLFNSTLHVPASALEDYRVANEWMSFGNIVALTDEEMTACVADMKIEGKDAVRYDLRGNRLLSPTRGLNILRMSDGTMRKVMQK